MRVPSICQMPRTPDSIAKCDDETPSTHRGLSMPSLGECDDEPNDDPPPVHRIVPANGQPFPATSGFVSVFDMAAMSKHLPPSRLGGLDSAKCATKRIQDATHLAIEREAGVVRVRRIHYLDTRAWIEQEAARRARQKPPKPTAKAKTKSRKLIEMVGA